MQTAFWSRSLYLLFRGIGIRENRPGRPRREGGGGGWGGEWDEFARLCRSVETGSKNKFGKIKSTQIDIDGMNFRNWINWYCRKTKTHYNNDNNGNNNNNDGRLSSKLCSYVRTMLSRIRAINYIFIVILCLLFVLFGFNRVKLERHRITCVCVFVSRWVYMPMT